MNPEKRAVHWDMDCDCYRDGPLPQGSTLEAILDRQNERLAKIYPHWARYGSPRVEPDIGPGPWRVVCACGWRGPVRTEDDVRQPRGGGPVLEEDAKRHEFEANTRERKAGS
jgi:hypothetical protein